jgi:cellulose biosynthesis protein BcsQ
MILTSKDAANALSITADVVRRMVKTGELSISKQNAGGSYEFSLQDIRAYIKKEDYRLPCSVISFANVRHNTGKTLFTLCVAETLNHLGYRVLVLDCDKQGDTSRFFYGNHLPDDTPLVTDIFFGHFPDNLVSRTPRGVDLIASNLRHSQIREMSAPDAYTNLHDYIERIKADYDFILLDTPPDTGLPLLAPLVASDRTFAIITPDPVSFAGIDYLYTAVNAANHTFYGRRPVFFESCILNRVPVERKSKPAIDNLREKGLQREIRRRDRFGTIVKRENRTFNVFKNFIPESLQYRQFYAAGANRENPEAAPSFFDGPIADKHRNSFVYVTLEILAELREHAAATIWS